MDATSSAKVFTLPPSSSSMVFTPVPSQRPPSSGDGAGTGTGTDVGATGAASGHAVSSDACEPVRAWSAADLAAIVGAPLETFRSHEERPWSLLQIRNSIGNVTRLEPNNVQILIRQGGAPRLLAFPRKRGAPPGCFRVSIRVAWRALQRAAHLWPTWACTCPEAQDVRFWLGACSDEDTEKQLSPQRWPPGCCHVRVVAVVPVADAAHSPT
jgi:hypothetical protein